MAFGIAGAPEDLDPVDWIQGKKLLPRQNPVPLMLHGASGDTEQLADIGSGLFTVCSTRLRSVLTDSGVDNIDYFPVRLEHSESGRRRDDYLLVNILGLVKAVDVANSTIIPGRGNLPGKLRQFTIDERLAGNLPLFRLAESPRLIVIEGAIKAAIEAANLNGIYVQATQDWTGFNTGPI